MDERYVHIVSQFCSCGSLIDEMTGTSGGSRMTFFIFAQVTAQELLKTKNAEGERHAVYMRKPEYPKTEYQSCLPHMLWNGNVHHNTTKVKKKIRSTISPLSDSDRCDISF